MASWNTPTTYATGDILSSGSWNVVANNEIFLYQAPYGLYYNASSSSLATGLYSQITMGGQTAAAYGFTCPSPYNNVVVPLTGLYMTSWNVKTSAQVSTILYKNGIGFRYGTNSGNAAPWSSGGSSIINMIAGETFALFAYQASGGAVNTATGAINTRLESFFVGSL